MFRQLLSAAVALLSATCASDLMAQDFKAMNAQFNAHLNAQMNATTSNIVQTNMNDPYVQQQYRLYLQRGGTLDFSSYCFRYAETGGFSERGMQNLMQSNAQIHARDTASMQAYHQYTNTLWQQTSDYRAELHDKWARQRGENLSATSPFVNSYDGSTWQLPNTMWTNQTMYDASSGNTFHNDFNGQMWMNNGNGWWNQMYDPN